MTLDIVVGSGLVILAVILALTVRGRVRERRRESAAREALARTVETGAQPASLHPDIDLGQCIGSGACTEVCPEQDVLSVIDGKAHVVNPTACIGHGECMRACPVDAIQLVLGTARRGVDLPLVSRDYETKVPGIYVVGELGGMGLIYNAMSQALQCLAAIARDPPPREAGVHQVLVVGAGPAGIAATLAAMDAGLDVVTLEQESFGGTVMHYPRHKVVMTRPVTLPLYGPLRVTDVSKEELLDRWQDLRDQTGLEVREGVTVKGVEPVPGGPFTVDTTAGVFRAQRVVLALGRRGTPRKLGIPGEDLGKVTYRLLDPEQYAGARCLVVGGGNAGVEAAISLGEAGAEVHLAHRRKVFDRLAPKNQARLDEAVAADRVTLLLQASPTAIHPDRVEVEVDGERQEVPNDYVLVFIGGVLPTKFLEAAGVEVHTFRGEAFAPANA